VRNADIAVLKPSTAMHPFFSPQPCWCGKTDFGNLPDGQPAQADPFFTL
jgi:hypothetical protein